MTRTYPMNWRESWWMWLIGRTAGQTSTAREVRLDGMRIYWNWPCSCGILAACACGGAPQWEHGFMLVTDSFLILDIFFLACAFAGSMYGGGVTIGTLSMSTAWWVWCSGILLESIPDYSSEDTQEESDIKHEIIDHWGIYCKQRDIWSFTDKRYSHFLPYLFSVTVHETFGW